MKPILYESTETQFTSNGLGRLADCIDCTVTEERNGIYECQFSYPVTGAMYSQIQIGRILGVIHDDVKDVQPFDIYAKSAPLDGVVTFYAHHISYRLGHVILKPMEASSCAAAFAAIPVNTYNNCPFTFWTDKAVEATWQNKTPSAVKAILGGQQGSILDVYGKGEYMWDKWLVRLYTNRGSDNNVSIRYGVNLTELQQELDDSGSYNAVAPYWVSREDGTVVTLTDGIVVYGGVQPSEPVVPVPMDLSDAFDVQPTETQLQTEALRRLTDSEAWLPSENITISFVDLAGTEDYKSVSALQRVSLCDRVSVYCGPLGVSAVKMQVIRVVYNVLTERYDEIELGKAKATLAETITEKVEEMTKDLPTASMMQQAINNATDKITGANGGHVRFIYDANGEMQEILIMDTDDINTAVKVWRWNSGGFGFSSNGYAGPYTTAMTMDGAIVADFITAGTMSANRISSGVIDGDTVVAKLINIIDASNNIIASFNNIITLGLSASYHVEITDKAFIIIDDSDNIVTNIGSVSGYDIQTSHSEVYYPRHFMELPYRCTDISSLKLYADESLVPSSDYSLSPDKTRLYYTVSGTNYVTRLRAEYYTDEPIKSITLGTRVGKMYGAYSCCLGVSCTCAGSYSLTEGARTKTYGECAHAEGDGCIAASEGAHAEGGGTRAYGRFSHAEGQASEAYGDRGHAEGQSTKANGNYSHAQGYETIANGIAQNTFGSKNIADSENRYIEIVGNANADTFSNRSNARTLDWSGNEWIAGTLTQASDSHLKEESGEVPDLSDIRARRFKWNDKKGAHDDLDHIGYFAQDVEKVAPYLVQEDAMGYKSLDYIALLCAKVEYLERRVQQLENEVKRHDD